jgi:hypothetical protein
MSDSDAWPIEEEVEDRQTQDLGRIARGDYEA